MAWAFLKEELVNTKETPIVKHLKERYPNLLKFTQFMDDYLAKAETILQEEKLAWNTSEEFNVKIINSL